MEITLWIIIYLAFVLPVAKCYSLHYNIPEEDCLPLGIFWPIDVLGCFFAAVIGPISEQLIKLIKD